MIGQYTRDEGEFPVPVKGGKYSFSFSLSRLSLETDTWFPIESKNIFSYNFSKSSSNSFFLTTRTWPGECWMLQPLCDGVHECNLYSDASARAYSRIKANFEAMAIFYLPPAKVGSLVWPKLAQVAGY